MIKMVKQHTFNPANSGVETIGFNDVQLNEGLKINVKSIIFGYHHGASAGDILDNIDITCRIQFGNQFIALKPGQYITNIDNLIYFDSIQFGCSTFFNGTVAGDLDIVCSLCIEV